jgi:DNA polymerase-3 subunit alpha
MAKAATTTSPTAGTPGAPGDVPRFAHLHLHTEYSLLDGGNTINRLIERVKACGMDAVAVTDHGNLHAAVEFHNKAKAAGIKPILGIEAYVAIGDRRERVKTGIADGGFHLVLLAEDQRGWRNLLKLSSDAYLNGFYYKPRMDKSTLEQFCGGLIAINGHLGSSLAHHLTLFERTGKPEHWEAAVAEARWHQKVFPPNEAGDPCFYVELQRHSVQEQHAINPHLVRLAEEIGAPLVCDNDAHFLTADDWDAHDSLCCISMGKTKDDPDRLHYPRDLYVKTPEEMYAEFSDLPEALHNTARIADRCNVDIDFDSNHAPVVRVVSGFGELPADPEEAVRLIEAWPCEHPLGSTEWFKAFCAEFALEPFDEEKDTETTEELKDQCDRALRVLSEAGAIWRYGPGNVDAEKRARLERELKVLADKLISAYFLIVWDFVNWARQNGIPSNARGSGVGTMVGFVLGLSNACPVHYGLLFERFTDPDRTEYPDIDIDICQNGRPKVIEWVREKYGCVAQIITFGRLKARQAIKDVARVEGLPAVDGQRLAGMVPDELNISIDDAIAKDPDFRAEYEGNPISRRIIDTARALENHARHAGIHAAGVVVATQPLDNIVPLYRQSNSEDAITQWDGPTCENVGLLKMDFLGLRTLSTIERAKLLIEEGLEDDAIWRAIGQEPPTTDAERAERAHPLDLERLRYDDQKVLELFRRGDTAGIFQFESGGMQKLLLDMQPDRLEDLIAANALFRPGPMDLIPDYCARKHGQQAVPTLHEIVDGYTAETYGIMIYQEQVMQIVHGLGGIPLRAAYSLIKAISKKKEKTISAERPKFIEGAGERGLDKKKAEELFELILKFAGYGFNKSHSTGYAIIAYQTAYLKTYFPAQYMAAVLTFESAAKKVEDWVPYLQNAANCRWPDHVADDAAKAHIGVEVKPPDLNRSLTDFAVVFDPGETHDNVHGHIRFGLGAIKGVGRGAVDKIIAEREKDGPFRSLLDFCERVGPRVVTKAQIESMIKAGALDTIHGADARSAMLAGVEAAVSAGSKAAEDRAAGQLNMFGMPVPADGAATPDPGAIATPEMPLPAVLPWDERTKLANEKEVLGIHLSGHPTDEHADVISRYAATDLRGLESTADGRTVLVGGMLSEVRLTMVRSGRSAGEKMAMITLEDRHGSLDGVVFSSVFAREAAHLQSQAVVMIVGRTDRSRGRLQLIVDRVYPVHEAPRHFTSRIDLIFDADGAPGAEAAPDPDEVANDMRMAAGLLHQAAAVNVSGRGHAADVSVLVRSGGKMVRLRTSNLRLVPDPDLLRRLGEMIGHDRIRLTGGHVPALSQQSARRGPPARRAAMAAN